MCPSLVIQFGQTSTSSRWSSAGYIAVRFWALASMTPQFSLSTMLGKASEQGSAKVASEARQLLQLSDAQLQQSQRVQQQDIVIAKLQAPIAEMRATRDAEYPVLETSISAISAVSPSAVSSGHEAESADVGCPSAAGAPPQPGDDGYVAGVVLSLDGAVTPTQLEPPLEVGDSPSGSILSMRSGDGCQLFRFGAVWKTQARQPLLQQSESGRQPR